MWRRLVQFKVFGLVCSWSAVHGWAVEVGFQREQCAVKVAVTVTVAGAGAGQAVKRTIARYKQCQ